MFTPEEIESIPIAIEKLFGDLQLRVMTDIVRRLTNVQDVSASADYQMSRLYELGKSKKEIRQLAQETLEKSDEEIESIFTDIIQSGYARDKQLYTESGKDFIPYNENKPLQQLVKAMRTQTKDDCRNITQSMGFAVKQPDGKLTFKPVAKYYQDTLDKAVVDITSGAFDYNTVLNRTVSEMTNSGLRTVDYASGYSNRVNVAARRAVMTGVRQVTAKISEDNAEKLETEYFEVSWHRGARPSHQKFQGKVYSRDGLVSVCGLGTVTGLGGANCYHSYDPFVMGVSERKYTDEWLAEQNAKENTPIEYNGKEYTLYEATQRQRSLETTMRAQREKIKLLGEGNADEDSIISAKARYFKTSDEYARFSKAMDLPQQRERVYIDSKVKTFDKSIEKSAESGIIKSTNYAKATDIFDFDECKGEITPQGIVDALEQTEVGKETLKQLSEKGCKPILDYSSKRFSHRGEQQGKTIKIYIDNIKSTRVAAQTVIHEATHLYYNIGQNQWAEAVCFAREKMFLTGRPLTWEERRYIVRLAKSAYPEFKWKKGGYGYKR